MVQENQEELESSGIYLILAYVDDINSLGENINTLRKAWKLLLTSKECDPETNAQKTKQAYTCMCRHQNAGQTIQRSLMRRTKMCHDQVIGNDSKKSKSRS
jgi:hypothetical protein